MLLKKKKAVMYLMQGGRQVPARQRLAAQAGE
jgi:hypothetical protein